jgi:hypothetical protein
MKCYPAVYGIICFYPVDGGSSLPRNVGTNLESSTAGYLRRPKCNCFITTDKGVIPRVNPICLIWHFCLSRRYLNKEIFSFSKLHQKLNINFLLHFHFSHKSIVLLEVFQISPFCPPDKSGM